MLAFANNTATTDYVGMAEKTMRMASNRLGIPYTIITSEQQYANKRIDVDTKATVEWHNLGRWQAYQQSPYDETILLDADYLVLTDRLLQLFESPADYLLCHENTLLETQHPQHHNWLSPIWATVLFFRKSAKSEMLFEMSQRIQHNYQYYRHVFNVQERNFRNDYAFSIADLVINGHQRLPQHRMPWGIVTADIAHPRMDINDEWLVVRSDDRAHVLPRQDLHVMSKSWFFTQAFDRFLEAA